MSRTLIALGFALATVVAVSATDQWPMFRGPDIGAIPDDPNLPESWSETENVVWKTDLPPGHSSHWVMRATRLSAASAPVARKAFVRNASPPARKALACAGIENPSASPGTQSTADIPLCALTGPRP